MKMRIAALAAAFLMMAGTAGASGGVTGTIKAPVELGFEVLRTGGERGALGVGIAVGGTKKKPDRRITLQLIPFEGDLSRLSDDELSAWYKDGVAPANANVFIEKSEEDGAYSFADVPAGRYYIVVIPPGLDKTGSEATRAEAELQKRLRNWEMYELFTLGMHTYTMQVVDVKDGEDARFDYDFSAPPFSGK